MTRPLEQIMRDIRKAEADLSQAQLRVDRYRAELEQLKEATRLAA